MTITNPKLSDRIRPDVEAAPWVIAEIEKLEHKLADLNRICEFDQKTNEQLLEQRDQLRQQLAVKQAEVDALMLEYCPNEMSQEQLDNWAAHQRPAKEN